MSLPDKLDEILKHYKYDNLYPNEVNTKRLTTKQAKAAILQAVMDSLPQLKLAEYTMDGKRCVIDEAMGYNQAIRDIKDRLEGSNG